MTHEEPGISIFTVLELYLSAIRANRVSGACVGIHGSKMDRFAAEEVATSYHYLPAVLFRFASFGLRYLSLRRMHVIVGAVLTCVCNSIAMFRITDPLSALTNYLKFNIFGEIAILLRALSKQATSLLSASDCCSGSSVGAVAAPWRRWRGSIPQLRARSRPWNTVCSRAAWT